MAHAWERVKRSVAGLGRSAVAAGRGTARAGRGLGRAARRVTHAQGAGQSGLGRLIELSAAHSAGDVFITIALAGTILFGVPVNQARVQVALYLLLTMAPFTVLAPFVGPVLDRFRYGRRFIMAGTLFARGLLCWAMAAAVPTEDVFTLFPAALGVLVLSKAYNVSRAAIMPNVLPPGIPLVAANARVSLFMLVASGAAAPVAAGLTAWLGPVWVLRIAMVIFFAAGVAAVRLPRHVDAPDTAEENLPLPRLRTVFGMGPVVTEAVHANTATRLQSGFLVFFLLFLVQDGRLPGWPEEATLAVLAGAAGAGGLLGSGAASWTRNRPTPKVIILGTLVLATVAMAVTAIFFTLWTAVAAAFVGAFAQNLGKLALDAVVQQEVGEEVRSATFGVIEAVQQFSWVVGGLIGLALSLFTTGPGGFGALAVLLAATLVWLIVQDRVRRAVAAGPAANLIPTMQLPHPYRDGRTKRLSNPHR